jgi:uncharacterized membrane protein
MQARAKAVGHAIHPMLIVFPLGLLTTAVILDVLRLITDRGSFQVSAAHAMAAGIVGGLVAALFGLVDWLAIPAGTRARRVGALHGLGNLVVTGLFAVSWLLRAASDGWHASALALVFSFAGLALSGATAWLGGELVERLGVGVDEHAGLDAPSSLSGRPARTA